MTENNTQHTQYTAKPTSQMLQNFKNSANPYYTPEFGICLNNVNFWKKFVDQQYIVVWAGGSAITFIGEEARNVLYNLGDRDSTKFRTLNQEETANVVNYLNDLSSKQDVQN